MYVGVYCDECGCLFVVVLVVCYVLCDCIVDFLDVV